MPSRLGVGIPTAGEGPPDTVHPTLRSQLLQQRLNLMTRERGEHFTKLLETAAPTLVVPNVLEKQLLVGLAIQPPPPRIRSRPAQEAVELLRQQVANAAPTPDPLDDPVLN